MTEKMKPSAIAWIGNIPESWDIGRVKDYYTLQTGFTPDTSVSEYYDNENGYLGILSTTDNAVITSGGYERYFEQNGVVYHHIIDPDTGYPSDSDLTSVTIVCADGTTADALSTGLFVMGLDKAKEFYRSSDLNFDMILYDKTGTVYVSESIKDNFTTDYTKVVITK